ncbi:MAG: hypothetical protein RLZZ403_1546 [Pseudomonadota bacterium]|jgi:hypothetical protein
MVSRRTLLKLGTAGLATAVVEAPAVGSTLLGGSPALARAVFDERYAEGRDFGGVFQSRGMPTSAIRGDVAAFWYRDLKARLLEQRLPIVGLTDRTSLFCLEELARDVGMKVQGRIDHTFDRSGALTHQVTGPAAWTAAGQRLGPEQGFGRVMASLLTDPTLHGESFAAQKHTGPFSAVFGKQLVSWWIA